jgi:hypothetical protein
MRYEIRPLGPWIDPVTADRRGAHQFRASWQDTLDLLDKETGLLGAQLVVLQVDVTEGELRRDGMLRVGARVAFPGVRVSFDSVHGPLTYSTDAYERFVGGTGLASWQANIRAIALALEALRAVDRYGVSGRGEQYRGWTAISARTAEMTREQAAEFIAHWAGWSDGSLLARASATPELIRSAYRAAAKRAHPDVTGDDGDTMARLNAARDLLVESGRS